MRLSMYGIAGLVAFALLVSAPMRADAAQFLKRFKDWSTYSHEADGKKICFATSQPKDMEPKNVKRDAVFFYVTMWPDSKLENEISVRVGYPLKAGTAPIATVGSQRFNLIIEGDRAYATNRAEEARLVNALRRGNKMTINGVSQRGTPTTDVYSLSGVTAAIKNAAEACR